MQKSSCVALVKSTMCIWGNLSVVHGYAYFECINPPTYLPAYSGL